MEYRLITLKGHRYSEACAARCEASTDLVLQRFDAIPADKAIKTMQAHGLEWTWANHNTGIAYCPKSGMRQHPYGRLEPKVGCFMSHFLLWRECAESDDDYLILEHDAVFIRDLPPVDFDGICQINDPAGATPQGQQWSEAMTWRGPGVFLKSRIDYGDNRPDGLAGNSAYLLKPWAAADLVAAAHVYGVWPNDALMCVQLFPYLEELFPFVTRVCQSQSTSS